MSAPCEACPPCCNECAWDRATAASAADPKRRLTVVRTAEAYGCVKGDASIVVDEVSKTPFMHVGGSLLPLSPIHGGVIKGTRLETDIGSALAH